METTLFVAPTERVAETARAVSAAMGVELPIVTCAPSDFMDAVRAYPDINVYISRGGSKKTCRC